MGGVKSIQEKIRTNDVYLVYADHIMRIALNCTEKKSTSAAKCTLLVDLLRISYRVGRDVQV